MSTISTRRSEFAVENGRQREHLRRMLASGQKILIRHLESMRATLLQLQQISNERGVRTGGDQ
jgi:hypothetical protein